MHDGRVDQQREAKVQQYQTEVRSAQQAKNMPAP